MNLSPGAHSLPFLPLSPSLLTAFATSGLYFWRMRRACAQYGFVGAAAGGESELIRDIGERPWRKQWRVRYRKATMDRRVKLQPLVTSWHRLPRHTDATRRRAAPYSVVCTITVRIGVSITPLYHLSRYEALCKSCVDRFEGHIISLSHIRPRARDFLSQR